MLVFSSVQAVDLNATDMVSGGNCGSLLIYKGIYIKTYYAYYTKDGVNYPAYCGVKIDFGHESVEML